LVFGLRFRVSNDFSNTVLILNSVAGFVICLTILVFVILMCVCMSSCDFCDFVVLILCWFYSWPLRCENTTLINENGTEFHYYYLELALSTSYFLQKQTNWNCDTFSTYCFIKHVVEEKKEGRTEVTWRWGRRRKRLLDDLKEKKGYLILKKKGLDFFLWRTRFGRGCGPVVRQTTLKNT